MDKCRSVTLTITFHTASCPVSPNETTITHGNVHHHERVPDMSPRELEVAKLMAQGYSNPEIASQLHISVLTVKNHVRKVYRVLGVNKRATVIVLMHRIGAVNSDWSPAHPDAEPTRPLPSP